MLLYFAFFYKLLYTYKIIWQTLKVLRDILKDSWGKIDHLATLLAQKHLDLV